MLTLGCTCTVVKWKIFTTSIWDLFQPKLLIHLSKVIFALLKTLIVVLNAFTELFYKKFHQTRAENFNIKTAIDACEKTSANKNKQGKGDAICYSKFASVLLFYFYINLTFSRDSNTSPKDSFFCQKINFNQLKFHPDRKSRARLQAWIVSNTLCLNQLQNLRAKWTKTKDLLSISRTECP